MRKQRGFEMRAIVIAAIGIFTLLTAAQARAGYYYYDEVSAYSFGGEGLVGHDQRTKDRGQRTKEGG